MHTVIHKPNYSLAHSVPLINVTNSLYPPLTEQLYTLGNSLNNRIVCFKESIYRKLYSKLIFGLQMIESNPFK